MPENMGHQKNPNIFTVKREVDMMLSAIEKDDFCLDSLEHVAKRLSEFGEIANMFVSGRLKKTADSRAIERILYVIELLNDYSYVEILKNMLLNESSKFDSEGVRIELLATLKSYDSHCLSNPFNNLFANPQAALLLWIERAIEDFDVREYRVISLLEEFLSGQANNIDVIKSVKEPLLGNAVSFLALLADCDNPEISVAAMKELGKIKDERAVAALYEIVKYSWKEDVLDGAVKALRRLSFSGYDTTQLQVPAAADESKEYQAFIGPIDAMGNFNLCLSVKGENPGVEAICLIANDEFGVMDVYGAKNISDRSFMRLMADAEDGEIFSVVDIEYFLKLVNFALYLNEEEKTALPPEFYYRKGSIKQWLKPEKFIPKFDKDILREILNDEELVEKGALLFDKREFSGWKISTLPFYEYAEEMVSPDGEINNPPSLREKRLLDNFSREIIIPLRGQIVRRLFMVADFFVRKSGYDESARIILATVMQLGRSPDVLWLESPFVTRLAMESVVYGSKTFRDGFDLMVYEEELDKIDE